MAIVILGGLATSTLMNLFVLPTLYLRLGGSARTAMPDASSARTRARAPAPV